MKLQDLESQITGIARKYGRSAEDREDFEQMGRIKAWELLESHPGKGVGFYYVSISNAILNELKKRKAMKRDPGRPILSLDKVVGDDDGATLGELVGEEDSISTEEELLDAVHAELRHRYGKRFWVNGLRDQERQPRARVRNLFRHLIEGVWGIPREDVGTKVTYQRFRDSGFERLLWVFYRNSPFAAVMDAYKGEMLPYEFRMKPKGFWKGRRGKRNIRQALEWFVEQKDVGSPDDCKRISGDDFEEIGLSTVLNLHYNGSPYLALREVVEGLKPWHMKYTGIRVFDSRENQVEAVTDFLQSHGRPSLIGLSPEETYDEGLRTFVSKDEMGRFGLRGLLRRHGNSPYELFMDLFPEQVLPWTLQSKKVWRDDPAELAGRAVRWLFNDYLVVPEELIPAHARTDLFWDVGFSGILTNRTIGFNSSPYAAVENAYPGRFGKDEFDKYRETVVLPKRNLIKRRK